MIIETTSQGDSWVYTEYRDYADFQAKFPIGSLVAFYEYVDEIGEKSGMFLIGDCLKIVGYDRSCGDTGIIASGYSEKSWKDVEQLVFPEELYEMVRDPDVQEIKLLIRALEDGSPWPPRNVCRVCNCGPRF